MQESLDLSLVRLRTADGHVVGAGFFVGERHILTCAHVVAGALGLADDMPEKPQDPVYLDVPRVAPRQLLTARIVLWRPPRTDGGDDIAGLELEGDPPHGAQPAPLAQVKDLWEHSFRAFGFPRGQDSGVWATGRLLGRQVTNWVQIEDVKETGFAVEPGFSGTPVWDSQVEAVVGMVVAAERRMNLKTAFAIPVDVLARSWPLLESLIHPFVFLCYARADSELVTRLKTDLLSQGIHVWIDREDLQPGTLDWEEALRTAIRAAQAVLLIASPDARSSRYVRDELRIAELYQRPVYLLWIAGTQWMKAVPLGWGGAQYLDAREGRYETALPELVEVLNKASSTPPKPPELDFEPRNPYKGLRAFTGDDARDFFGRDTLINELTATLAGALVSEAKSQPCARLLAVVGPSGSGKSSVVMAGLLPRLREGRLPGSEQWVYLDPIVPGARPIEALTLALSEQLPDKSLAAICEDLEDDAARGLHLLATKLAKRPGTKVVLVVDQFEELFTQTPSEDERRHFLDLLVTATTEPRGPVIVLLTLRADFYDRPMRYPLLHEFIQAYQTSVLPMAIPELREVIEKPAALPDVRLTFEGDLVGDLLFEVQGQVGALPLLQFTLEQLFQRRSERSLTLSAYRELGGVKGALTRQAEETYATLPSNEHRKLARTLFVRLIDPGASEQDTTRRRAALSEFTLDDPTQTRLMQETIDTFIEVRLLTTNEVAGTTTIEVSHEALIREWPRLAGWLREARKDILLQQAISEDVAEWERRGKLRDRLYRGSQLKEAREWATRNLPSKSEVAFLHASVAYGVRFLVSMMTVVLLVVSSVGIAGWFYLHRSPDPTHVTTLSDGGPGSLRWDIANAPSGSTITFDPSLWGHTMVLTSDLPITGKHLNIQGPGVRLLTISSTYQIGVRRGSSISISGLTFKGSKFNTMSLLSNEGTLSLTNCTISGNTATGLGGGGGILNNGTLSLTNCTISGNTVTGPNSQSLPGTQYGGGIDNESGTLTLTNSTISSNTAQINGGGIFNNQYGTLSLTNSTVSGNTDSGILNEGMLTLNNSTVSDNTGGGIFNYQPGNQYSTVTLNNSTVSGNTDNGIDNESGAVTLNNSTVLDNTAQINGGGIFNNIGRLTLSNSTVSGNKASRDGGGIFNGGALTLSNSTVSGNMATGSGGGIYNSGGIYNNIGTLTLSNSTVSGNMAIGSGGGISNEGMLTLSNSAVPDNTTTVDGGGIYNYSGTLMFTNSTVSGNKASRDGGGIAVFEDISFNQFLPSVMLLYCTVYSNTADVGGGIWAGNLKHSHVTIGASIVAGNNAHTSPDIVGPLTTLGYNLIGDRSGATFLGSPKVHSTDVLGVALTKLGIDPVLRDNGGLARPHTWTHALLLGSPAIDLIPPDVCMMFKVFNDQRGVKRPQGKGCDSGAYEYVPSPGSQRST